MRKLTLLSGGAIVTGTMLVASAGAFAAVPDMSQSGDFAGPVMNARVKQLALDHFGGKHGGKLHKGDLAKALGMTPEELRSELQSGKTLEQVAEEHGTTADHVLAQVLKNAGCSDEQIRRMLNAFHSDKLRIGVPVLPHASQHD